MMRCTRLDPTKSGMARPVRCNRERLGNAECIGSTRGIGTKAASFVDHPRPVVRHERLRLVSMFRSGSVGSLLKFMIHVR